MKEVPSEDWMEELPEPLTKLRQLDLRLQNQHFQQLR